MAKVRVGVIGVGALGRHHARLYGQCPEAALVGVYDVSPEAAAAVAEEAGTAVFDSPEALAEAADALSVAVPTDLHFPVVSELLSAGKHVLVEKPLAASVSEGRRLAAQAQAAGLVLQVGHVERFNPVITYLEGKISSPRFIEAHRLAPYPPPRTGRLPRGTEVGVVLDLMIHDIDIILHLVNSPVSKVEAVGIPVLSATEDIANARIAFETGCIAALTASRVSPEPMRKIRVFQPDAYLSLDYGAKQGEVVTREGGQIKREPVPIEDHNALYDELTMFVRTVAAGRRAGSAPEGGAVPAVQAQAALEVAERITQAIAAHNAVHGFG